MTSKDQDRFERTLDTFNAVLSIIFKGFCYALLLFLVAKMAQQSGFKFAWALALMFFIAWWLGYQFRRSRKERHDEES
jgi:lipopolysaccharide export LptBFGC system permease protein LptF